MTDFVALNEGTWLNVDQILAIVQADDNENVCHVRVKGGIFYTVHTSAKDFLNRMVSAS